MTKTRCFFLLLLLSAPALFGQTQGSAAAPAGQAQTASPSFRRIEFDNQPIADILRGLGMLFNRVVSTDATVSGNASFYIPSADFATAMGIFCSTRSLYWREEGGIVQVSRIRCVADRAAGTVAMDAEGVALDALLQALMAQARVTIVYDSLPRREITVHFEGRTVEEAIGIVMSGVTGFRIENLGTHWRIALVPAQAASTIAQATAVQRPAITRVGDDLYDIDAERARVADLVDSLFTLEGREYSSFLSASATIDRLRFSGKSFEELLRLILEQAGGDWTVRDGIYYLVDYQRPNILRSMDAVHYVPLRYIEASQLVNLFPPQLIDMSNFRVVNGANAIILTGSPAELAPVLDFIARVDRMPEGMSYHRYSLSWIEVGDIEALLPPQFKNTERIDDPDTNSFSILLNEDQAAELSDWLGSVDAENRGTPIRLRYIRAEQLLEHLPPSAAEENIVRTQDENLVFFRGSEARLARFLQDLAEIDRPVPQIRYQLLVVQYDNDRNPNYQNPEFSVRTTSAGLLGSNGEPMSANQQTNLPATLLGGAAHALLGSFGSLLGLSFDVLTNFGYQFAVNFSYQLNTGAARVLADTTLNGISDQQISFNNTQTTRYTTGSEVDPDTGEAGNVVVREISSGLTIDLTGWVSGDGMITMEVTAEVSKELPSSSGTNADSGDAPPSTSQRRVETFVRTASGTPVILSGLFQTETVETESRTPVLGDIPLVGGLFRSSDIDDRTTEMVIYIIPFVEYPAAEEQSLDLRLQQIHDRLVQ